MDGAILDVSSFSHRHPGGARLILNAVGTDVTHELLGQDLSVGHAMSFTPHVHPEVRYGRTAAETTESTGGLLVTPPVFVQSYSSGLACYSSPVDKTSPLR